MIRLATLYPDRLNLNGDQGNLLVLEKRIAAYGGSFETVNFEVDDDLAKLDGVRFLLLGHGSMAAWKSLTQELERIAPALQKLVTRGCLVLAVASGAEMLFKKPVNLVVGQLNSRKRNSNFAIGVYEGLEVLGYENSATDLPTLQRKDSVIVTSLHGPMLAKNPTFTDLLLRELGLEFALASTIHKFDFAVEPIWNLEKPLANE